VGVENTPIYVLDPKQDHHGLGYDPFRDAEEFRAARAARRGGGSAGARGGGGAGAGAGAGAGGRGGGAGGAAGAKRGRGVAFGAGAGSDDDVCGIEFEDYIDEEQAALGARGARRQDVFAYEDASESGGW
jgi:G patch domain-containing protein 1